MSRYGCCLAFVIILLLLRKPQRQDGPVWRGQEAHKVTDRFRAWHKSIQSPGCFVLQTLKLKLEKQVNHFKSRQKMMSNYRWLHFIFLLTKCILFTVYNSIPFFFPDKVRKIQVDPLDWIINTSSSGSKESGQSWYNQAPERIQQHFHCAFLAPTQSALKNINLFTIVLC